jgi:lipoprotein-anchoring transpeptidase ErfK/SrfK
MRRLSGVLFVWLVAFVMAATPLLATIPVASAQSETGTPVEEVIDDGDVTETPVDVEPTATIEPTEPITEEPTDVVTEEPTATATETVAEEPTDDVTEPATEAPTDEPTTEATEPDEATETVEETEEATETPTKESTEPATDPFSAAAVEDIQITLKCTTSPETIRVTNVGAGNILLKGIATYLDPIAEEPFAISRTLKPGQTAIFQSGQGAQYGTVLTNRYIFTNSGYDAEGVRISTSVGKAVKMCDPKPVPPPPPAAKLSDLKVTLSCTTTAETIRVANTGTGWATIKGIATYIDPIADEPFAVKRVLKPGQTAIFQAGEGAKYGTVLTKEYIFTNAAYEKDGVRIATDVGKLYKACPAKPVPLERWIEVNLSTQYLIAWYGNTRVNETYVSTGKPGFDTPTGTYYVLTRYRTQTMSGCIQGECYYVPDVPWVQYFTNYGHALHGAYWHNDFGTTRSHGCVNLPLWFAEWLWNWATYGTRLWIHY